MLIRNLCKNIGKKIKINIHLRFDRITSYIFFQSAILTLPLHLTVSSSFLHTSPECELYNNWYSRNKAKLHLQLGTTNTLVPTNSKRILLIIEPEPEQAGIFNSSEVTEHL